MRSLGSGPLTTGRALASYPRAAIRSTYLRRTRTAPTRHEQAFLEYQLRLPSILRGQPTALTVTESVEVAASDRGSIREITLSVAEPFADVGDMVYLPWHNDPDSVAAVLPERAHPVRYWSTPAPGIPAVRRRATPERILTEVLDLGDHAPGHGFQELLRCAGRIVPRVYTLSSVESAAGSGQRVRLLVSRHLHWPSRASAYLHRAGVGDVLKGWALPHPHRLPSLHGWGDDGLVVVTGSGIAGVLAVLRSGASVAPWVVWGVRGALADELRSEVEAFAASGAIRRLDIVDSLAAAGPRRVTDILEASCDDLKAILTSGHWVYVSGRTSSGEPVRAAITDAVGHDALTRMHDELRYIEST